MVYIAAYSEVVYCIVLYCALLYCATVLYWAMLYCTVVQCTGDSWSNRALLGPHAGDRLTDLAEPTEPKEKEEEREQVFSQKSDFRELFSIEK